MNFQAAQADFQLGSGLRVVLERRAGPGFAFDLRLPWGSAHDPAGQEGCAGLLEEWLYKGAGDLSARALQDALDDLGLRRSGGVGAEATRLGASGLRQDLPAALGLVAQIIGRPWLPPSEFDTLSDLARQDLESLQDSPSDRLALALRAQLFPYTGGPLAGYAHPTSGTREGLQRLSAQSVRDQFARYGAAGSVLGIVADYDPEELPALVEQAFGGWQSGECLHVPAQFVEGVRYHAPDADTEQTHFSLMSPAPAPRDPHWLAWQVAVAALSGGTTSRLFHAVREERGLAYSVSATPVVLGGCGFLSVYAGSTPERIAETLEVVWAELRRWTQGLEQAEFERAKMGVLTGLVFGAESLRSRAAALTRDIALFGSVRSVAALKAELEAVNIAEVNDCLAGYDLSRASLVTLGPEVAA